LLRFGSPPTFFSQVLQAKYISDTGVAGVVHLLHMCDSPCTFIVQVWQSLYKKEERGKFGMYITTVLLHPKSVGTIRLKGPNPDQEPLIDPKFLNHPDDARTLKEGRPYISLIGQRTVVDVGGHYTINTFFVTL